MRRYLIPAAIALTGIFGFGGISWAQCTGIPSANTVCAGPASGGAGQFSGRKLVPGDLPAGISGAPTFQTFTTGSGTYTPTSPTVTWIKVTMAGGGGAGGGASQGGAGAVTSFGGWTANGGTGGAGPGNTTGGIHGNGGSGGTDGAGSAVDRIAGGQGSDGANNSNPATVWGQPTAGTGYSAYGGAVGKGGAGGSNVQSVGTAGSGGGAETVIFVMVAPFDGLTWIVGAGGTAAGGSAAVGAGNAGGSGRIRVEEHSN